MCPYTVEYIQMIGYMHIFGRNDFSEAHISVIEEL
jgi:hypothetical protein